MAAIASVSDASMRASVLENPGRVVVTRRPRPTCPSGGVLVRVKACGVCSTDVKMAVNGHRALVYPRIAGHEICGTVEESRTRRFSVGDRIQVAPGLRCGRCIHCLRAMDQRCQRRQIFGFSVDGGFAEYLALPLTGDLIGAAVRLPTNLAFDHATLAEPLACCINLQSRLSVGRTDRVLVVGAGLLGLLHVVLARHRKASWVQVVEPQSLRRSLALELGADEALDPSALKEMKAASVDVVILAAGAAGLNSDLSALLARGARIGLFSGLPGGPAGLPEPAALHYEEYCVCGSYGCAARHNRQAVSLLARGIIPAHRLITRHICLERLPSCLTGAWEPADIKTIVEL